MKNKIISVVLSITIVLSTILQPVVVRANPVVYLGGGLFAILMTALAHAGYTVENQDSANYIYNFFFKKWLSDEDLKNMGLEGQSNAKEFWQGIEEKLTTPLDEKYPSLKGVFEYKVTSSGAKLVANATSALKEAIDQLIKDLPEGTVTQLGTLTSYPISNTLPFTAKNCFFPTVSKSVDGTINRTTEFIHIKILPKDIKTMTTIYFIMNTHSSTMNNYADFGRVVPLSLPAGVTDVSFCLSNNNARDVDYLHYYYEYKGRVDDTVFANIYRPNSDGYTNKFSFTFDHLSNCTIASFDVCDSLWEIPFNEGSKALYRDNEAIWEQMGSIEAKLDDVISQPLTDSYPQSIGMTFPLTQEVADTYVQEKDEIDIKSKDEVKEEESNIPVTPEVEMDGIYENSGKLTDKFPFCIPFDIAKCINGFSRTGNPVVQFTIPFPYVEKFTIHIDLSDYETPLAILRFFELLGFILGILILTRNIIKG